MAAKLGFEAIKYVLTKVLTKKGSKGIARIPGKAYDMRMKQLVDEMATKMRNLGYDINKVTEKNVHGLLDSAEALAKQKAKKASDDLIKRFDDIGSPPKKKPTTESSLKGEEYIDESGRSWTFAPGTKKEDLPSWTKGWNPKIVPKETEAQIKARMIKENRSNVQKSYLRQLDEKIIDEMELTKADLENMSSTALDDLRRNADPQGMQKHFDDITEGRGVGDFADDPDFFKDDYASGGIARLGMAGGGALFKFIEKLFIKASNDIRLGRGKFKGLDQKQRIVQHDNLTKKVTEFQKSGKLPEGTEQYFDVNPHEAFAAASKKVKKVDKNRKLTDEEWKDFVEENSGDLNEELLTGDETLNDLENMVAEQRAYADDMYQQYKRGDLDKYVKPEVLEESRLLRQKKIDEVLDKAYDEIGGGSGFSGDYKYDADVLADSIAEQLGKGEFTDLSKMYQTDIYNTALNRMTKNLKAKMDFKKGLKDVEQKIELQMFDTKGKKPHAEGGRASLMYGGDPGFAFEYGGSWADWRDRHQHQMPVTDYIKTKLPKERLPFRDPMIFGGSAGLRGLWKRLMRASGPKTKTIFPKLSKRAKEFGKLAMPSEVKGIEKANLMQLENMLEALKIDKQALRQIEINKQIKDPGLDFLMGKMKEDKSFGLDMDQLSKYTDIDNDILMVEQMIKNKTMKGRKLHQSGGLAYMLGEPTYMKAGGGRIGLKKGSESWRNKITRWMGGPSALAGELGLEGIHQLHSLLGMGGLYSAGGSVGHAPWHKPSGQPQPQQPQPQQQAGAPTGGGRPNPMKAPRGLPSVAPRTMDPAFMQQQAMQKAMMGQGQQRMGQGQPRMGMAEGKKVKKKELPEELPPFQGPDYETDIPKEAAKEIIRRVLGEGVMSVPIGGGFQYGVGYGKDKPFDYGIGWNVGDDASGLYADYGIRGDEENVYTGGYKGDNWDIGVRKEEGSDPTFGFNWKKKFNQGGRIGFGLGGINKGRRAFMKWLAGILGTGVAAGTGLIKLGKAAKVVPKVTETIARGADGMPIYITNLLEVVKAKGIKKMVDSSINKYPDTVHSYKGVDVTEDVAGNIKIKSDKSGVATDSYTGKTHEGIAQENHIQIEKGQMQVKDEGLETQKSFQEPDEYVEGTVYPDMDGKMKDWEEGLDEAIHLDFKKIADEVDTLVIKKASGGRVPLGGGGIIKILKKALKKFKNVHDVSNAKIENYIMDQGYKLGKYYKKNPGKGLSHSTAVGTGVLISRHLDRQKRGKKASGGVAQLLGE